MTNIRYDFMPTCISNLFHATYAAQMMIVVINFTTAYHAKTNALDKNEKVHDVPTVQFGFALG